MPKSKHLLGALLLALSLVLVATPALAEEPDGTEEVVLTTQAASLTLSGASRIPVGATAYYKLSGGSFASYTLEAKEGNVWFDSGNKVVRIVNDGNKTCLIGEAAGTTTIRLVNSKGKVVLTKKVEVYDLEGKNWEIQTAVNSGYVLDIRGKSKANSARMIVWPRNGGKNQRYQFVIDWKRSKAAYLAYAIKCVHSGKYVDVQGGGTKKSQPVIQYTPKKTNNDNQLWRIEADAKNRVTFVNLKSGMVFDIQGGRVTKRAQMIQYPFNGGNNQKWILNKK